MATSTCIKCDGHIFEIKLAEPRGSQYKVFFVQCTSCGGVVGVVDYYNIPTLLEKIAKKIGLKLHN